MTTESSGEAIMKICIEINGDEITSQLLYECLQNFSPKDCDTLAAMAVDEQMDLSPNVTVFRPE
jgi:hypothetical protein